MRGETVMYNREAPAVFFEKLEAMFQSVDFGRLDRSCNTARDGYAKEILKRMHGIFVEVYGTDYLDNDEYEFVDVPAIIRGRNTGHIWLGIVTLDLESSAEHCGTYFLTSMGVIDHGSDELSPAESKYLSDICIPYDFWYTVYIEQDHYADFTRLPRKVAMLMSGCNYDQPEMVMK